ncbi:MAG: hypothetical protein K9L57_12210 [Spirochaetaceae bacterium]|nr:hypothetical protein [Spirochaetaceae bacterium]
MKVLDAFKAFISTQTGVTTVLEPQSLEVSEPNLRLMISEFDSQGENRERLTLTASLVANGDGPDYFLDGVISASRAFVPFREGSHVFDVEEGFMATATFTRTAPGRFERSEEEGSYAFSYIEQFRVELSYNPAKL